MKKKNKEKKRKNIAKKMVQRLAKKKKKTQLIKTKPVKLKKALTEKQKRISRVPTGIPGFDKLISGGFDYGSINLVVGGSGSGKTIFAMQFLIEGIKRGETVLYITFEESKQEFYENMLKFGWDLEKLENSGKFIFLEYSPEKVKMMLDEGGGAVESTVIKQKVKRMVIDSISSFSLLFEAEQEKRHSILALFDTRFDMRKRIRKI